MDTIIAGRKNRTDVGISASRSHMQDQRMDRSTGTGARQAATGVRGPRHLPDHRRVIAIDGAAAAGKTTVARDLADRLQVTLFDTGVLYRTVTLAAQEQGIRPDDADSLARLASGMTIDVVRPTVDDGRLYDVLMNGRDVTWEIRAAEIDQRVSEVSAHRAVRDALLPVQRSIADGASVVMVGRDIGTVVAPGAGVKIYLVASLEERARRRHGELTARGQTVDPAVILADLARRDAIDAGREVSPLAAAPDAVAIETDGRSVDDVVDEIERLVADVWASLT